MDGVLITAATQSDEPVRQAAQMCRKRGRIVLVGVTGLELSRTDFYEKELTFQVSCSYGPGRYDTDYEEKGHDYPVGYVRWSAQRNFEAALDMMTDGRLDPKPLVSHRFRIDEAASNHTEVGRLERRHSRRMPAIANGRTSRYGATDATRYLAECTAYDGPAGTMV